MAPWAARPGPARAVGVGSALCGPAERAGSRSQGGGVPAALGLLLRVRVRRVASDRVSLRLPPPSQTSATRTLPRVTDNGPFGSVCSCLPWLLSAGAAGPRAAWTAFLRHPSGSVSAGRRGWWVAA